MELSTIFFYLALIFVVVAILSDTFFLVRTNHVAMITCFGKRVRSRGEGLHLKIPFLEKASVFSRAIKSRKILIDDIFAPDDTAKKENSFGVSTDVKIEIEVAIVPGDTFDEILNFMNFESIDDIYTQFSADLDHIIRNFAADPYEEPKNWQQALGMGDKFLEMVVAAILGHRIPKYTEERLRMLKKKIGTEDGITQEEFDNIVLGSHVKKIHMSPEEKERKEETKNVAMGLGSSGEDEVRLKRFGSRIHLLKVSSVKPNDEMIEAIASKSKEEIERTKEVTESITRGLAVANYVFSSFLPPDFESLPEDEKVAAKKEATKKSFEVLSDPQERERVIRRMQIESGKIKSASIQENVFDGGLDGALATFLVNSKKN